MAEKKEKILIDITQLNLEEVEAMSAESLKRAMTSVLRVPPGSGAMHRSHQSHSNHNDNLAIEDTRGGSIN